MSRARVLAALASLLLAASSELAAAQEVPPPPVGADWQSKLFQLGMFIGKGAITAVFAITLVMSLVKFAVGHTEKEVGPGGTPHYRGMSKIWEAFSAPFWLMVGLVFLAWMPDLLNWFGLIPPQLQPYVTDFKAIFGWGGD